MQLLLLGHSIAHARDNRYAVREALYANACHAACHVCTFAFVVLLCILEAGFAGLHENRTHEEPNAHS